MSALSPFTVKLLRNQSWLRRKCLLPPLRRIDGHVPAVRNVACVPETVQTPVVVEAKATVRLEVAVPKAPARSHGLCAWGC